MITIHALEPEQPKSAPAIIPIPNLDKTQLLESISFTNNGKSATPETQLKVLNLVRRLETKSPPSPNLLSDPKEAQALSGLWYVLL